MQNFVCYLFFSTEEKHPKFMICIIFIMLLQVCFVLYLKISPSQMYTHDENTLISFSGNGDMLKCICPQPSIYFFIKHIIFQGKNSLNPISTYQQFDLRPVNDLSNFSFCICKMSKMIATLLSDLNCITYILKGRKRDPRKDSVNIISFFSFLLPLLTFTEWFSHLCWVTCNIQEVPLLTQQP